MYVHVVSTEEDVTLRYITLRDSRAIIIWTSSLRSASPAEEVWNLEV